MSLKRNIRQLLELFLVPGIAVVLPWRWCFLLFKRLSLSEVFYAAHSNAAFQGAATWREIDDPEAWKSAYRLIRLIDYADLYLSRTRPDRWMKRFLRVEGSWPSAAPFLTVTFHWGAGMWALRHLRAIGIPTVAVGFRPTRADMAGQPVAYWYGEARLGEVDRIMGQPIIDVSRAAWDIRRAWRQGKSVLALYDVPRGLLRSAQRRRAQGTVLGRQMDFPAGLVKLAQDASVPVNCFDCAVNRDSGERILRIHPALTDCSEQEITDHLTRTFESLLDEDLAAWHLNAEIGNFLSESTAVLSSPESARESNSILVP